MAKEKNEEEYVNVGWHWRNSQKTPRFWRFDARAGGFILLVLFMPRRWTFMLFIIVQALFWILERKGLTFSSAIRAFRVWIVGPKRPALIWSSRRKLSETE